MIQNHRRRRLRHGDKDKIKDDVKNRDLTNERHIEKLSHYGKKFVSGKKRSFKN